jgi:uncharacterized protein (DUF2132 family)
MNTTDKDANTQDQPNNPLHGVTLERILLFLVEQFGWERLYGMIRINCFGFEPSVKSSLKFLRKNEWARTRVENLYLDTVFKMKLDRMD